MTGPRCSDRPDLAIGGHMSKEDMEKEIEAWAADNKERAKALGLRLIRFNCAGLA